MDPMVLRASRRNTNLGTALLVSYFTRERIGQMMKPFDNVKVLMEEECAEVENAFMVNRILSFAPECFLGAAAVNRHTGRLPYWAIRGLFNLAIPKNANRKYFKYAKRKRVIDQKLIGKIRRAFCVNEYHAKQIIEVLRRENRQPERFFGLKEGE